MASQSSITSAANMGGLDDNVYDRLLRERIIFLGAVVEDKMANASMGQFLLCAGAPGKRYALPHARIMMHQPSGGISGTASDIKIQAEQMMYTKRKMAELIAEHTGQTQEQIAEDSDRDRWFTAEEAAEYGFVDSVVRSARQVEGNGGTSK